MEFNRLIHLCDMPFHFSLQSRPDTFGNIMYDIRSAIIPCIAAHGQRQAVIVHEPGDPPRCGFIDREGIALQCDLVHPSQRTEVPLVEIQGSAGTRTHLR